MQRKLTLRLSVFTAVLAALALAPLSALAQAHAHVGHVAKSWSDTPGRQGLLPVLEQEAAVAAQHAGFMAGKTDNLQWMQTHARHVRHAIDPSSEPGGGPGKGYGVLKSAQGVVAHIGFAAKSPDASDNVKLHAVHIATSAQDAVEWAQRIMTLSGQVLAARSADEAAGPAREIQTLATQIVEGAGAKSWKQGEGGIAQARQHLGFLMKGEGMM
ncbi:MAG: hypothetical protein HY342_07495 [Candidatus Lambdaproteobacteria bacterium]|nr:hypothetical protein [Candidatus Lambdaproteobacteria bacterium]